jgi:hypothetical protein
MPKWVYPLAFVFLIFLIYTDPTGAGQIANAFIEFLSTLLSALGEFLSGLFGDVDSTSQTRSGITVSPNLSTRGTPTTDVFQHGHTHQYNG